jgi:hypothetical protein|uniref:Uncharacterized protein n=1 Tax=Myoviridae sp. ctgsk7 TaxID=2825151 RepID=A0A8S5PWS5_9CAUD|nr:MAG TPA: hypothetical protein [Myoviridae sp. ctgsk7]
MNPGFLGHHLLSGLMKAILRTAITSTKST